MYDKILIDGNNFAHKVFYTQGNLSAQIYEKGELVTIGTGILYGLIQSFMMLKKRYNGEIIVCWDKGYKRRKEIFEDYKANRKKDWAEYENFTQQKKLAERILPMLGIIQAYKEGEEADDIVGSLSKQYKESGFKVLLCSNDHDYYQLIAKNVHLYRQAYKQSDKLYNKKRFVEDFGITPRQYIDVMSLTGDKGDNVPGLNRIGEKTAIKIITQYPNIVSDAKSGNINFEYLNFSNSINLKLKENDTPKIISIANSLVKIDKNLTDIEIIKEDKDLNYVEAFFEDIKFFSMLEEKNWSLIKQL